MKVQRKTLENGLRVIVAEMPDVELVSTNVTVGAGGRYETPEIFGISHFLEHMAFKGTKKYPTYKDIILAIEQIGGRKNAMTSEEFTSYWNKVPCEHLDIALDVLAEQVSALVLDSSEIDKERGVIIEEINRSYEDPMNYAFRSLNALLWPGQNAESDVLGPKKNIKKFKREDFQDYIDSHYTASNMTIAIAGGIKSEEAFRLVEEKFSHIKRDGQNPPAPIDMTQKGSQVKVLPRKLDQSHVIFAYKGLSAVDDRKHVLSVLMTILAGGMGSVLFEEIREKRGLAYAIAGGAELHSDAGFGWIYAGLNGSKTEEAIKVIKAEFGKIKNGTISEADITRAKEYLKGNLAGEMDGTEKVSEFFGIRELLTPGETDIELEIKNLELVTKEDIVTLAKEIFVPERENLLVVGDFQSEEKFVRILNSEE